MGFHLIPGVDVSDADAAVGDVKSPKTFYSVAAPRKTGTLPTKAIVATAETYEEGYHAGNPGGLSAIEADLAPANIKKDENIFGKVGTFEVTLTEDLVDELVSQQTLVGVSNTYYKRGFTTNAGTDSSYIASVSPNFTAGSMAVGVANIAAQYETADTLKLRLYMGGVQVAESGYIGSSFKPYMCVGTRALSGVQEVKAVVHNYSGSNKMWYVYKNTSTTFCMLTVGVGSIKK